MPWPEGFPPNSESSQLWKLLVYVRVYWEYIVCFYYQWYQLSLFCWFLHHHLLTVANALTGSIPSELGQLTALGVLALGTWLWGLVPLSMVSSLTLSLNCVSQPLHRWQCLDRKHSLRARRASSFGISCFMYVLLGDCLSVLVSTINGLTTHAFVELCLTTSRQMTIPWPEAFPPSSDSSQLCNIFI